jgi:dynein heavy chain
VNTRKKDLKLPRPLNKFAGIQKAHYNAVCQNIAVQWRDYFVAEIQDDLKNDHDFYVSDFDIYKESKLKKIVTRFELLLHTYIREFVKQSIDDWVTFIKDFTVPKYDDGEMWKVYPTPLIVVALYSPKFKKDEKEDKEEKGKKDKKDKKDKKGKKDSPDKTKSKDDDEVIALEPSLEECTDYLVDKIFDYFIRATNDIKFLEFELMPFLKNKKEVESDDEDEKEDEKDNKKEKEDELDKEITPIDEETGERIGTRKGPNFKIDRDFPWIKEGIDQVKQMIEENIHGPLDLLEQYRKFDSILTTSKKKKEKELFDPKQPLERIREEVEFYHQAYFDIMNLSNAEVDFNIFRVDAGKLKSKMCQRAESIKQAILKATYEYCVNTVNKVHEDYEFMKNKISTDPKDEAVLVDVRDFIKGAENKVADLKLTVHEIGNHMRLLEDYCYPYDDRENMKYWKTHTWPIEIAAEITLGSAHIEKQEEVFMNRLANETKNFREKVLEERKIALNKIKQFKKLEDCTVFATDCYNLKTQLEADGQLVEEFNRREELFELPLSKYEDLDSINEDFNPYFRLIPAASDVTYNLTNWTSMAFVKLSYEEVETTVIQNRSLCNTLAKRLEEDNPEAADAAHQLRSVIDDFRKHLPLIKCMSSEAIMEDDWEAIKKVVGQEDLERDELNLQQMIDDNFGQYLHEIEEVVMKAEKKLSLRNRLKELRDEAKLVNIELFEHKSGTYVVKGYNDIFTILDDQIVATQTMLGSQFMDPPLRKEARQWEGKLSELSDIIEEIRKCQKNWMYLEPIFSSDDIQKQLPTEGPMFLGVDSYWRQIMELTEADPGLLELLDRENIKSTFQSHNQTLDLIQKSLNDYLEAKRRVFPRFYFLSNDDLLLILAQTKDPLAVQDHMEKCFEGIQQLIFEDRKLVCGMISAEGEKVDYLEKTDVEAGDKKGNVENWLLEVEASMINTLKKICSDSVNSYANTKRTEWVLNWPGQIILAVSQIYWTEGVEDALKKKGPVEATTKFEEVLQGQIEDIVILVRGELPAQTRVTLKALVVIDVHARDVVRTLIKENVSDPDEFGWSSQLRYYWESKDNSLLVKMVNAVIKYGFEYLGNSPRLVITPLTDRCYITLMGAKHLNYGGAPEGPAGTGKTESVKDLAKAVAVQCVVFNCSDGLDFRAMGKFFKGLASSGAWC